MEQFNEWSFSMRKIHKAQPAGEAAYMETKGMDEGEAPKIHTLIVKDDPEELQDSGLPEWVSGNDFLKKGLVRRPVLIGGPDGGEDGAILREQSKLVLGGSSKMGKTWLMLDLALAVACGGKWLGHFQCEIGRVLYVNLELHDDTAGSRGAWVGKERGYMQGNSLGGYRFLNDEHAANFNAWHLRGHCYELKTMLETSRMRFAQGHLPFKLIVLDPIYKTYSGRDENSATEMASLMLDLEDFANDYKASVAFAAHFSKGNQSGKDAVDRISGSGVMARDPDAIITFTPHEQEEHHVMEATLREFAPIPATVFRWEAPIAVPAADLDPTKLRQPGKAGVSKAEERTKAVRSVLEANDGGPMASHELISAAIKASGVEPTPKEVENWRRCLKARPDVLANGFVEILPAPNGQDPRWQIKTAPAARAKDPF
jgi:hypothetical protein